MLVGTLTSTATSSVELRTDRARVLTKRILVLQRGKVLLILISSESMKTEGIFRPPRAKNMRKKKTAYPFPPR